jgi:hypothetical protein
MQRTLQLAQTPCVNLAKRFMKLVSLLRRVMARKCL